VKELSKVKTIEQLELELETIEEDIEATKRSLEILEEEKRTYEENIAIEELLKLKERVITELKLDYNNKYLVIDSSSSKETKEFYHKVNSTFGWEEYYKLFRETLTLEQIDRVEEYFDEYLEDFSKSNKYNFYYLNSILGVLEELLNCRFGISLTSIEV